MPTTTPTPVVAAIDQGTQSTRVFLYSAADVARSVVASHQVDLTQHYPHPG
jgi:glycerol kinase